MRTAAILGSSKLELRPLLALVAILASSAAAAPDLSPDALVRDHLWREVTALPAGRRPAVGLVLSAGAMRAMSHVGVIYALENAGFPSDVVSGTSMGAVIGALFAAGKSSRELWEVARSVDLATGTDYSSWRLIRYLLYEKLFSSQKIERFLRQEIGERRFETLSKPFACVAMDLYSGEAIIFREGRLASAVRASMNLPAVFEPVEYRHRFLVDGGVVDYIPIDAAKLLGAKWILASFAETNYTGIKPRNVFDGLERVIDIRGALLSREQSREADFLITPQVSDIKPYETVKIPEAIRRGVIAAHKALPAAEESYILFSLGSLFPAEGFSLGSGGARTAP